MFNELENINKKPQPFEVYTALELWNDEHTSEQMLNYHLNSEIDVSSRNHEFIGKSIKWISDYFGVSKDFSILDLGCGPGLYANRLAMISENILGVDFSKRSIDYAKDFALKNNLNTNFLCENYLNFQSNQKFDLVIMVFCDFCALSPKQRSSLLKIVREHLNDDGRLLLDVCSFNGFKKREPQSIYQENQLDGFWSKSKYYGFLNTFCYEEEKVVLDKYTIIESSRARTIYNWMQYFSFESLQEELLKSGLEIQERYLNVAGDLYKSEEDEFAVVIKKTKS